MSSFFSFFKESLKEFICVRLSQMEKQFSYAEGQLAQIDGVHYTFFMLLI